MEEEYSEGYVQEMYRQYLKERATDETDMEPHKRSGYAERMAEFADMRRKEDRENAG